MSCVCIYKLHKNLKNYIKFWNEKNILNLKTIMQQKPEETKSTLDDEWAGINFTVDNETGTYEF